MATCFPLNPEELEAEERQAERALREQGAEQHAAWRLAHVEDGRGYPPQKPGSFTEPEGPEGKAEDEDIDEEELKALIAQVPSWSEQLTLRGVAVGSLLGALFCVVVLKLFLGPGIIPSLNIAAGLLAFCALQGVSWVAGRAGWGGGLAAAVGAQEVNVVQTFITACSSVAFTGGFGSYLTAMDRKSYDALGGEGAHGNRGEDVYEPALHRIIPYLLSTSVIGVFMLVGLRKTMIIDYNLVFPSGTATGLMIDSFFTKSGAATAGRQLAIMGRTFAASLAWVGAKWFVSGENCGFCSELSPCGGFERVPIFGMAAARWTFFLAVNPNMIGAGMICPVSVNASLVLGSLLTWGLAWPWLAGKEGDWYPAGLGDKAFSGLFGYKVFITISLIMGDGLYNLCKVMWASLRAYVKLTQRPALPPTSDSDSSHSPQTQALSTKLDCPVGGRGGNGVSIYGSAEGGYKRAKAEEQEGGEEGHNHHHHHSHSHRTTNITGTNTDHTLSQPLLQQESEPTTTATTNPAAVPPTTAATGAEPPSPSPSTSGASTSSALPHASRETRLEHALRTHVFVTDVIPGWVSAGGYLAFGVMGALIIPLCYPVVKWYYVVCGFLAAPLAALPVSFGCGLTDWDVSSQIGQLAIFVFAGWAGLAGGGVIVGLAMAGVLLAATSTCATLMQDFRTGYIVKCAPKAMFAAQVLGALAGALLAPLTFSLFWATGKVGDPHGPYPNPFAAIYRAMAVFGTQGMGVLPRNCAPLMLCALCSALTLNILRDTLPKRVARFIPLPMAMAIPCVLGAYIAIDMALGSIVLTVWQALAPAAAELYAPALASGMIVGDGVAAIPLSILGMMGVGAPMCMAFAGAAAGMNPA